MRLLLVVCFRTSEEAVWGLLSGHGLADQLGKAPFCLAPNGSSDSHRHFFFWLFVLFFFNVYLFLIDWWLVYSNGLIFVTHQHEYIPSLSNLPPTPSHLQFIPTLLGYSRVPVWVPESYGKFPLAIYLHRNVWFSEVLTMCHFLSVLEVLTHIIQSLQPPWLVGTPIIPLSLL